MTTKLKDLMAEFSPKDRSDIEARARLHIRAMEDAERLDQVRRALNMKQSDVAKGMGIGQNAVSQLEGREDMQLSTLHRYVKSLGLRLELAVVGESGERAVLKSYKPWKTFEEAAAKAVSATAKGTLRQTGQAARKKARAKSSPGQESAAASQGRAVGGTAARKR